MKNVVSQIPQLQKSKEERAEKKEALSCCSQAVDDTPCCTPSNAEEHNGACCAQPTDGSSCCDK